jgi:DEAD/DEAH box helicase domain-containing protein
VGDSLVHDLIGSYQRLDHLYRLYLESAFPLRSSVLAAERAALLRRVGVLSQPPLVETVPLYPSSNRTLSQAAQELATIEPSYAGLAALGSGLIDESNELYDHQWRSLREVLVRGRDIVVTTGTGSGKTESFLFPLLAHLARESASWTPPRPIPPGHTWWNRDRGDRISQWGHATRPTALRAIILYPLNALVEDQLRRLRSTLDSDEVHRWMGNYRSDNRITFGRYTGLTPVAGPEEPGRLSRLRADLLDLERQRREVLEGLRRDPQRNEDAQYYFPRMDGGEMWSRWDMQETPPDILITNYSMLNIMLMRSIEDRIFEQTRRWLAEPGHPERQFFLIVDELHAYRGTPGTEVAYILRLVLERLGLASDSPNLRILTTTASLENDQKGRDFLREFFGRDQFEFIEGQQIPPKANSRLTPRRYQAAFEQFVRAVQPHGVEGAPDVGDTAVTSAMDDLAARLGRSRQRGESSEHALGEALAGMDADHALRDACRAANGSVRPTRSTDLDDQLFPAAASARPAGDPASYALRGLMLALGMSRRPSTGRSPQPVRGHLFFHNLQNLWACCDPSCDGGVHTMGNHDGGIVHVAERKAEPPIQRPTVGALHCEHRLSCACGARVLDLIVCEVCGDLFLEPVMNCSLLR